MPGKVAPNTIACMGPGTGPGDATAWAPAMALSSALFQLMIILGGRGGEGPPSQLLNHWLHPRYVSGLGVPCCNVAALFLGPRGPRDGVLGNRALESQIERQPEPLGPWGQIYGP